MLELETSKLSGSEPEALLVTLRGPIDETAGKSLSTLHDLSPNQVIFDFCQVEYVNSLGIRNWINFIRHFQEGRQIVYRECPPDIVMQMNMMPSFQGGGRIESFYASYECPKCGYDGRLRFETTQSKDELLTSLDKLHCERCQSPVEIEEDKDSFLIFLER